MATSVSTTGESGASEVFAQMLLTTEAGGELDYTGIESLTCRLNLGAADELELQMPAQTMNLESGELEWRPDMAVWKTGGTIYLFLGYDGTLDPIQIFEIVSTTTDYPDGGDESMVVRAVSDLARAARNKTSRTFTTSSDYDIVTQLCDEYGWTNGTTTDQYVFKLDKGGRTKESGVSDLEFLRLIATENKLGGPRVDINKTLYMPDPVVGELVFTRGSTEDLEGARRLHSFSPNRESGGTNTRVSVRSWDPIQAQFIETIYEADPFGGDPTIVFEGPSASKPSKDESSTTGLVLEVVESRGSGKKERHDVLATGKFMDETDAADLAARWFQLREKLSRWGSAVVDGHKDLQPYVSLDFQGNMAETDKGQWLPTFVEHTIDGSTGWTAKVKCIRIVEEPVISPAS